MSEVMQVGARETQLHPSWVLQDNIQLYFRTYFYNLSKMELKRVQSLKDYSRMSSKPVAGELNYGIYGNVQLVKSTKNGQVAIMKKLNCRIPDPQLDKMKNLHHPNLVNLLDHFSDKQNQSTCIILEYKESRPLLEWIRFSKIKDRAVVDAIYQAILSVIGYLHSKNLYRLDVKAENILIDSDNVPRLCYIAAAFVRPPRLSISRYLEYLAPEVILKLPATNKVDLWALGILLFEMIQGRTPFLGRTELEVYSSIKHPNVFSSNFTSEQIQILTLLFKVNPQQRPQVIDLLPANSSLVEPVQKLKELSKLSTVESVLNTQRTENRIKLVDVKTIHSPRCSGNNRDLPTSPSFQYFGKLDKVCSFPAYNKPRISLKKELRKSEKY